MGSRALQTLTVALILASFGVAEAADAQHRAFVACPIVRDTSTVPCWLSESGGELYYLGIQTDVSAEFHPPSLGHKVMVEGKVADKPRICGGIVLEPVEVSILPELDGTCNTMWPAEAQYEVPFAPRPPGPSGGRLAFDRPRAAPPAPPKPPYQPRTFEVPYPFDAQVPMPFGSNQSLTQARAYALLVGAKKIEIVGWRGATKLSNGQVLAEHEGIGLERANHVAELLRGVGLAKTPMTVAAKSAVAEANGIDDATRRRVTVVVSP